MKLSNLFEKDGVEPLIRRRSDSIVRVHLMNRVEWDMDVTKLPETQRTAFRTELAQLYDSSTWTRYAVRRAKALSEQHALAFPLRVEWDTGYVLVYDLDEKNAHLVMQLICRYSGAPMVYKLRSRRIEPIFELDNSDRLMDTYCRVYDGWIEIRKPKDTRGTAMNAAKAVLSLLEVIELKYRELKAPFYLIERVEIKPATKHAAGIIQFFFRGEKQSRANYLNINYRTDAVTFRLEEMQTAQDIKQYIEQRNT